MPSIYKQIADEVNALGGKATGNEHVYVLLHALAVVKGKEICDSASKVKKASGLSQKRLDQLAKESLEQYAKNGLLVISSYFRVSKKSTSAIEDSSGRQAKKDSAKRAAIAAPSGNIYKPIIDEINSLGGRATGGETLYVLLHRLAKVKGQDMNGSAAMVGRAAGITRSKVNKLAREAMQLYLNSNHLIIPSYFRFRESKQYKHDGDADADRNLWKQNRKIYTEIPEGKPLPEYTFNTTKK